MVALDVEQSAPMLRKRRSNNDNDNEKVNNTHLPPPPPPGLPARHPLQIAKRSAIIGGTIYAFHGENNCCFFHIR